MRELTFKESVAVSGAENHNVTVIDPVAAFQTFAFLVSVSDQDGFIRGSTIAGMIGGTGLGAVGGYSAAIASGFGFGILGAIGGAGVGAIVGGLAFKTAANFGAGSYNWIMG